MLQNLIVALIVGACALYAGGRYLPAGLRQRIVYRLARGGARQAALAKLLDTESSCGGGCSSCQACATPDEPAAPASSARVIKLHLRR